MKKIAFITILLVLTACGHSGSGSAPNGEGGTILASDLEGDFNFSNRTCITSGQNLNSSQISGGSYFLLSFRSTQLTYKNYTAANGCLLTNTYEFSLVHSPEHLNLNFLSCGYSNGCPATVQATCDQQNNANYGGGNAGHSVSYQIKYSNGVLNATDGDCSTDYNKIIVNPPTIL